MVAYQDAALRHYDLGWRGVLPGFPGRNGGKAIPPPSTTGANGVDPDRDQVEEWVRTTPNAATLWRLPEGVVGLDVDHYDHKTGQTAREELERQYGQWAPTWCVTARATGDTLDTPSGIFLYRVPPGRYATSAGKDIDVIQRHHRFLTLPPTLHVRTGLPYRLFQPDGTQCKETPLFARLWATTPLAPEGLVAHLLNGASQATGPLSERGAGEDLLAALLDNTSAACHKVAAASERALADLRRCEEGGRHDTTLKASYHLVQLGAEGHPGVGAVLSALRTAWDSAVNDPYRDGEFDSMLISAARKAVGAGLTEVTEDPCLTPDMLGLLGDTKPVAPTTTRSLSRYLGVESFLPRSRTDALLAVEVWERVRTGYAYAQDAGVWLVRNEHTWTNLGSPSGLATALVQKLGVLLPMGDPDGDKDAEDAYKLRLRFLTQRTSSAVGSALNGHLLIPGATGTLQLRDLDADPDILWAGGRPWDLRKSTDHMVEADLDPATPHLHTACAMPEDVPTPRWDAFLAAMWPDPEVRTWCLRVLAVSLTGYPGRVLPILVGETGRGKTQLMMLLMDVLGSYASTVDRRLLQNGDNSHAHIVYALKGLRLAFIDESPRSSVWAQSRLKSLTGGGTLTANEMRQNSVSFTATHTLALASNSEPPMTDPALVERIRYLPCEGDLDQVRDARAALGHLDNPTWLLERPGVLYQLVLEAARGLADPHSTTTAAAPESVRAAVAEEVHKQDPFNQWLEEEMTYYRPGNRSSDLRVTYNEWARRNRRSELRHRRFGQKALEWHASLPEEEQIVVTRNDAKYYPLRPRTRFGGDATLPTNPPLGSVYEAPKTQKTESPVNNTESPSTTSSPRSTDSDAGVGSTAPDGGLVAVGNSSLSVSESKPTSTVSSKVSVVSVVSVKNTINNTKKENIALQRRGYEEFTPNHHSTTDAHENPEGPVTAPSLPVFVERNGGHAPIASKEAADKLAAIAERSGGLAVDIETTGYPYGHRDHAVRTVQLGDAFEALVFDATDPTQRQVVAAALAAAPKLWVYSATADIVPLGKMGLLDEGEAWPKVVDVALLVQLSGAAVGLSGSGLKTVAAAVLGEQAVSPSAEVERAALFKANKWLTNAQLDTDPARSGWAQVDSDCDVMLRYAASDVLDTHALALALPAVPPALLEREHAFAAQTARLTAVGVRLDLDRVSTLLDAHRASQGAVRAELSELGVPEPTRRVQVAKVLTALGAALPHTPPSSRYPSGQPSVSSPVLEELSRTPGAWVGAVDALLRYHHHSTLLNLFLDPYQQRIDCGDGRVYPTVYTLGAATGRTTSARPNVQQVPREGGVRQCYTADPGFMIVSADFAGVELRVAAALSGDENLCGILREGRDLHWEVAREMFGPEATKSDRYVAKRVVFGRLYGGGVATLAKQAGVSASIAAGAVDVLDATCPQLAEWSRELSRQVRQGRSVFETYSGRCVYFDRLAPHKAPNYAIQGTARELLVDALADWRGTVWGASVVLPVHDEVLAFVPADEAKAALDALVGCMTRSLNGVLIKADPGIPSFAWQDAV